MNILFALTSHKPDTSLALVKEDFSRRYGETYMRLVLVNKAEQLVYVYALTNALDVITIDSHGMKTTYPLHDIVSLQPWLPQSGYYQLPTKCIYVERRPARQWKRSFNLNLYRCNDDISSNTILDLFETWKYQQHTYQLDDVDEDSPQIKLTDHLATGYSTQHRRLCIMFEDTPIAKVTPKKKQINLIVPQFKQELSDFLRKRNLHHWKLTNEY